MLLFYLSATGLVAGQVWWQEKAGLVASENSLQMIQPVMLTVTLGSMDLLATQYSLSSVRCLNDTSCYLL